MEDVIGTDMEIQSDITLRFIGENYSPSSVTKQGNVTTYRYSGQVRTTVYGDMQDLSDIVVTVTRQADGTDKIYWKIPGSLVPEYERSRTEDWFYEQLPARLIFKVGLKDEVREQVERGERLNEKFYTNSQTVPTVSRFEPTDNNPYFKKTENQSASYDKEENVTGTRDTYYERSLSNGEVSTINGNNGYIVFKMGDVPEPGPDDEIGQVTVQKLWRDPKGSAIEGNDSARIELWYQGTKSLQAHDVTVNFVYNNNVIKTLTAENVKHGSNVTFNRGSRTATYTGFTISSTNVSGDADVGDITVSTYRSGTRTYYYVSDFTAYDVDSDVTITVVLGTTQPPSEAMSRTTTIAETAVSSSENIDPRRYGVITLTRDNSFIYTWNNLVTKTEDEDGYVYEYTYYVVEPEHTGFEVTYSNNDGIKNGTITVTNVAGYELPETGGTGTAIFYALGVMLIAGASVLLIGKAFVRKKED